MDIICANDDLSIHVTACAPILHVSWYSVFLVVAINFVAVKKNQRAPRFGVSALNARCRIPSFVPHSHKIAIPLASTAATSRRACFHRNHKYLELSRYGSLCTKAGTRGRVTLISGESLTRMAEGTYTTKPYVTARDHSKTAVILVVPLHAGLGHDHSMLPTRATVVHVNTIQANVHARSQV